MKIPVFIRVPPGDTCQYPPENGAVQGYACSWMLTHMAVGKRWCRIFNDADVSGWLKCNDCLNLTREEAEAALQAREKGEWPNG